MFLTVGISLVRVPDFKNRLAVSGVSSPMPTRSRKLVKSCLRLPTVKGSVKLPQQTGESNQLPDKEGS
jgi:hypothetical protein